MRSCTVRRSRSRVAFVCNIVLCMCGELKEGSRIEDLLELGIIGFTGLSLDIVLNSALPSAAARSHAQLSLSVDTCISPADFVP